MLLHMFLNIYQFYYVNASNCIHKYPVTCNHARYNFTHLRADGENKMCGYNEEESNAEHKIMVIWIVLKVH